MNEKSKGNYKYNNGGWIWLEVESDFNRSQHINFISFTSIYSNNRTSMLKKVICHSFSLEHEFLIRIWFILLNLIYSIILSKSLNFKWLAYRIAYAVIERTNLFLFVVKFCPNFNTEYYVKLYIRLCILSCFSARSKSLRLMYYDWYTRI